MNYVIIGNSSAGIACVEAIRESDKISKIILISDEEHKSYSRPVISYLLAGAADESKMWYRSNDFYEIHNVTAKLGKKVESLDSSSKVLKLADGEEISYDKLLIATGGTPFIPDIKGVKGNDRVFTFTKWQDVEKLKDLKDNLKSVVVIGAGMIGTKAAEAFVKLGLKVTLVELAGSVLCRALDEDASKIVSDKMTSEGIDLLLNNEVREISLKKGALSHVVLHDGKKVSCDAVIVAIGVMPNVGLVKGTEIKVNRGIVVNEKMETSVTDIYAAGDVTEAEDMIAGGKASIPILPLAYKQGAVAGKNMSSQNGLYDSGFAMNSIEFLGVSTISFGIADADSLEYEIIKKTDIKNGIYKKIILKDNRIVGAVFVGDVEKAGIISALIKENVDVSDIKQDLVSDDFGYISFSRDVRREKLEKAV